MSSQDRTRRKVGTKQKFLRLACFLRGVFLLMLYVAGGHAADGEWQVQQHKISAAYLYHFLQLVNWPDDAGGGADKAWHVCILGKDPFGDVIDVLTRKKARGREVVILRVQEVRRADECQLLYVSTSRASDLPSILKAVEGLNVLTVSDIRDFVAQGGIIGLVTVADERESGFRVRFEINLEAARRQGFRINSKLLELATFVRQ